MRQLRASSELNGQQQDEIAGPGGSNTVLEGGDNCQPPPHNERTPGAAAKLDAGVPGNARDRQSFKQDARAS